MIIEDNIKGIPYAPPQMTIIPIRTSGAMLVGSLQNNIPVKGVGDFTSPDGANPGNGASEDILTDLGNNSGWGDAF